MQTERLIMLGEIPENPTIYCGNISDKNNEIIGINVMHAELKEAAMQFVYKGVIQRHNNNNNSNTNDIIVAQSQKHSQSQIQSFLKNNNEINLNQFLNQLNLNEKNEEQKTEEQIKPSQKQNNEFSFSGYVLCFLCNTHSTKKNIKL